MFSSGTYNEVLFHLHEGVLSFLCVQASWLYSIRKNDAVITIVSNVARVTLTVPFLIYRSFTISFAKHTRIHPVNIKIQIERSAMYIICFAEKNYTEWGFLLDFFLHFLSFTSHLCSLISSQKASHPFFGEHFVYDIFVTRARVCSAEKKSC